MGNPLLELEPCGPGQRPPSPGTPGAEGGRRSPRRVTAALAVVAALVMGLPLVSDGPPPTPQERLERVADFLDRGTPVDFSLRHSVGRQDRPSSTESVVEGTLGTNGDARWRELSPKTAEDVIDVADALYRRTGTPQAIAGVRWTVTGPDDGAGPGWSPRAWALPEAGSETNLFSDLRAGRLGRLLRSARGTVRTSQGELVASLPLGALYERVPGALVARARLTVSERDGRPTQIVLHVDTERDTILPGGTQARATYSLRTDLRFGPWGLSPKVVAPPRRDLDLVTAPKAPS